MDSPENCINGRVKFGWVSLLFVSSGHAISSGNVILSSGHVISSGHERVSSSLQSSTKITSCWQVIWKKVPF